MKRKKNASNLKCNYATILDHIRFPFFVKEKDTRNFQKTEELHNKCHGTKEKNYDYFSLPKIVGNTGFTKKKLIHKLCCHE